jgi:N-carbamoylputrescine amidase
MSGSPHSGLAVKVALIQMRFAADRDRNVERAAELVGRAAAAGARVIAFPELATSVYFCHEADPRHYALAESVPGPTTEAIGAAAREAGAYVIVPLYERDASGQLYNTAVLIDAGGQVAGSYRKNSIPFIRNEHMVWMEKFYFRPGNLGFPVFTTELGVRIGILICYDRHFPEAARALALGGADLIVVPTATASGREIWELELRAHAVANQLWVAGVNRVGRDEGGSDTHFYGSSVVVGPDGQVVAAAGDQDEEIVYAEIDPSANVALRDEWGFFRDRRPDAYARLVEP